LAHLDALAKNPRPAGSAAAAAARSYCAAQLRSLGFSVVERPFTYSALPGRYGASLIGCVGMLPLALASALGQMGYGSQAARLVFLGVLVTIHLVISLSGRGATQRASMSESGVNLEASRGAEPGVWLVAHIDSKSQPVSTAVRTTGVLLLFLAIVFGVVLSLQQFFFSIPAGAWLALGFLAIAGGGPLALSTVGNRSDGAADNASGVASVLEAAALVDPGKSFGVLITDAEEIALAGARAWVKDRKPGVAVNCDTVDDDGAFVVMFYGRASYLKIGLRALELARAEDREAMMIRPLPGVLTDSLAFRDEGWETVTLGRGTIRTLNRIHTPRDNLASMRGTGIPAAARILARLVEELA
jgi:hypothetical protein